ncbi:UNVERIFIED_CONTAM: hypothetical protein FKN15_052598 [Acipenser sinensis]
MAQVMHKEGDMVHAKRSKTLIVRHLPSELTRNEKEDLLKYFGAVSARVFSDKGRLKHTAFATFAGENAAAKKHTAFATFAGENAAAKALTRLHQLEILNHTLVVEFAKDQESVHLLSQPVISDKSLQDGQVANGKEKTERKPQSIPLIENGVAPSLGLHFPPNPCLKYLYPPPTNGILANIANAMASVPKFYVQVLHLMNRMNLPSPFGPITARPPLYEEFVPAPPPPMPPLPPEEPPLPEEEMEFSSEEESEYETEDDEEKESARNAPVHAPRRSVLGARTSVLGASVHAPRRSVLGASVHAPRRSVLGASVHAPRRSVLGASVHAPRRSVLGARASTLGARASTLGARASTLGARASTLGARASTLGARASTLGARASTLGARASTLGARASTLGARASTLGARASTLGARASTLGARASTLGARTSTLGARCLGARTSTLGASVHAPRRSVHAPRRSVHAPRRSVHAPRRSVHAPRRSVHAPRRSVHAPRRSVHAPRRSVHAPRRSVHAPRRSVHAPRCSVHAPLVHAPRRTYEEFVPAPPPPMPPLPPEEPPLPEEEMEFSSEEESEYETEDDEEKERMVRLMGLANQPSKRPQRKKLPSSRKKPKLKDLLYVPKPDSHSSHSTLQPSDVFEQPQSCEQKKIEFHISANVSGILEGGLLQEENRHETTEVEETANEEEGVGFGKIYPTPLTNDQEEGGDEDEDEDDIPSEFISRRELEKGRISKEEIKRLSVFKKYEPGDPTCRLYVKNVAKQIEEKDLKYIFGRYIDFSSDTERNMFDIVLMKEGRMKGQAFIGLPSEKAASKALKETNGYVLYDKPMEQEHGCDTADRPSCYGDVISE